MVKKHLIKPKEQKTKTGKYIKSPDVPSSLSNVDHPIFCFRYIKHRKHGIKKLPSNGKAKLITKLHHLSQMTWYDIQLTSKGKNGAEKLPARLLPVASVPGADKITDFLAIRYDAHKRFVGYQNEFVFHILWIDVDGKLYDHG